MKNTISDLNNYLFEQLERLQDDELDEARLEREIKRSEAVQKVAETIINNGNLAIKAIKTMDDCGYDKKIDIPLLGITGKDEK